VIWLILIVFPALIVVIGVMVSRRRTRRIRMGAMNLATALGFERLEGKEAVRRLIPANAPPSAMEDYEKMPGPLRRLLESSLAAYCIAGTVDGARITIYLESRGGGKSQTRYTVVRADYPKPLPFELGIAYEDTFTRLGKALFGLRDIETGDEAFDRAVRIKAGDEVSAKLMLGNPETKAAILGLFALSRSAFATDTHVQWERQGARFDPSEVRTVIAALVPVTRTLGNG